MGSIIRLILQGLKFGGPAAIGYFFNDATKAVASILPSNWKVMNDDGTPKWWFVLLIFVLGGVALYFVLMLVSSLVKGKGKKGGMFSLAALLIYFIMPSDSDSTYALVIATLTTGAAVVTTAYTTYIPRFFYYVAATQLTGVKITVQGDGVIFDSDANGLTHCGVNRLIGQATNTYWFRIASGLITGKNTTWEFTNSAAQTPTINVDSDKTPAGTAKDPKLYLQLVRQVATGPGGTDFTDFTTLSFPSMAAADYLNVLYIDGTQQSNILRGDLQGFLQLTQNVVNTPIYMVDNYGQRIKKVNIQVAATQTGYIQRWVAPMSDGMLSQAPIAQG